MLPNMVFIGIYFIVFCDFNHCSFLYISYGNHSIYIQFKFFYSFFYGINIKIDVSVLNFKLRVKSLKFNIVFFNRRRNIIHLLNNTNNILNNNYNIWFYIKRFFYVINMEIISKSIYVWRCNPDQSILIHRNGRSHY